MPEIIPQMVGMLAVLLFLLSYQQTERRHIILCNVVSRCLYILQYLLLGAFAGAVLDIFGALSSVIAGRKQTPFIRRHTKAVFFAINACIVLAGVTIALLNRSWLDLFSLVGVLLHTSAFWLSDERIIRRVSLLGSPFWLVYNFSSRAYGSAVGDVLTICSILLAILRYRRAYKETK